MSSSQVLAEQVRAHVRAEGIDPVREAERVRVIAQRVAAEHDESSLTGAVAPLADPEAMVGEVVARVSGLGPLQPFLDDPEVEEIWINDPSRVFVARGGRHELTSVILTTEDVRELVERMLASTGRRLDLSQPFVDATLPGGHRLHVVLEGISRGFAAVNIRKFVPRLRRLADLVAHGALTPQAAAFLRAAVQSGHNVVVSGGTQCGKTTLLNALAGEIGGGERVVSAEEVFELRISGIIHTCGRLCTFDNRSTALAMAPRSSGSASTARSSAPNAAGKSRGRSSTTTPPHRRRSRGRSTARCSRPWRPAGPRSWSPGTSTASRAV